MKVFLTLALLTVISAIAAQAAPPGGGWDANNAKISVSRSKLLTPAAPSRGGWDGNNVKPSVVSGCKLLSPEHK